MGSHDRRDRGLLVLGALLVALLFLALDLHYAGGEVVLPLDDAYIYAQYARSIAEGRPLSFTPDAPPSAGVTGLLYPFVLAPLWWLSPSRDAFPALIFALQAGLFAASAPLVRELAGGGARRAVANLAAWLFVLSGPLAWGYLCGMEVGLFAIAWLATGLALASGRERAAIAGASVLTLVRPDGLVQAALLWLVVPASRGTKAARMRARAAWLVPLAVGLLPIAVNLLLTGSPAPASGRPKSPFALPGHHLPTLLQHVSGFLLVVAKELLSGTGGESISGVLNGLDTRAHVAPFTLLFLLAGLGAALARGWRSRGLDGRSFAALWLLAELGWVAVSTGSSTHFFRYLLPAWPALVILVAEGARQLARPFDGREEEGVAFRAAAAYLLLFGALSTLTFGLIYGKAAHGFKEQYVACSRWIDESLPAGARVASLDAGIVAYYAGRPLFDLYGLTTPSMTGATVFYADDEGSKFEVMERLPDEERPTHFLLHERRFQHESWNPWEPLLARREDGSPRVLRACDVSVAVPLVGRNLQLRPADWSGARTGERPDDPVPGTVLDRVDVADRASEVAHGLRIVPAAPGFLGSNRVVRRPARAGGEVVDGGRGIEGAVSFTLRGLAPGRDATVRLRLLPVAGGDVLRVSVDGRPPVAWEVPRGPAGPEGAFREPSFTIDGSAVGGPSVELTLEGRMMLFHAWALAPAAPGGG